MPRIPKGETAQQRGVREAKEVERRLRKRQMVTLKIAQMELKTIIPVIDTDMDDETAKSLSASLRTVATKAQGVASWLEARMKKPRGGTGAAAATENGQTE